MPSAASKSSRVSFSSLTENNLGTVRKLNSVLFPIRYSEKFYQDILKPEVEEFCKLVYYNDIPVGTICCRLENKDDQEQLYLMTMGVLAPYRSREVGSKALESVLEAAAMHSPKIQKIYLHVQVSNEDAKRFYERHGFTEVGIHKDYYKKISPPDAWVLEKRVTAES
ncbi:N-acetyltransferase NAT13 [Coprinopsis cinerea okayama7|uniref:N-acetyltransferase NAT13 n=1 Tax=Coprinopsis cinerea (strain Okayama-7 / 130 / ATCC MYA-4618 / FGSC 9003) TaxID=240176 RepID=A8N671_COPC7|nr:N-acetyltransferase NAT13 [Coprinopsis cinerea okayama7\|eukprot:XP_001830348.1 N-acetyltransferase NAT13 [Coprinopsis cinerea okayama7\